jgi:hypothetical protein
MYRAFRRVHDDGKRGGGGRGVTFVVSLKKWREGR